MDADNVDEWEDVQDPQDDVPGGIAMRVRHAARIAATMKDYGLKPLVGGQDWSLKAVLENHIALVRLVKQLSDLCASLELDVEANKKKKKTMRKSKKGAITDVRALVSKSRSRRSLISSLSFLSLLLSAQAAQRPAQEGYRAGVG